MSKVQSQTLPTANRYRAIRCSGSVIYNRKSTIQNAVADGWREGPRGRAGFRRPRVAAEWNRGLAQRAALAEQQDPSAQDSGPQWRPQFRHRSALDLGKGRTMLTTVPS